MDGLCRWAEGVTPVLLRAYIHRMVIMLQVDMNKRKDRGFCQENESDGSMNPIQMGRRRKKCL